MPAADYRGAAGAVAAARRLRSALQARLQPGDRARLLLARRLRRLRRRAVAARARARSTSGSPGTAAPSCPTTPTCWRAPQAEVAGPTPRRARCARWADELRSPHRRGARARRCRRWPRSCRTLTPAQLAQHREALSPRRTTSSATTSCSATRRSGSKAAIKRAVERAEMLYGRLDDAQRELRRRSSSPHRRSTPSAGYAERQRAPAGHRCARCAALPPSAPTPAAGARPQLRRAGCSALERSPRETYRALPGAADRRTTASYAAELHNSDHARAARRRARRGCKGWDERPARAGAAGRLSGRPAADAHGARAASSTVTRRGLIAGRSGSPSARPRTSPAAASSVAGGVAVAAGARLVERLAARACRGSAPRPRARSSRRSSRSP